jgi:hypothetical protein
MNNLLVRLLQLSALSAVAWLLAGVFATAQEFVTSDLKTTIHVTSVQTGPDPNSCRDEKDACSSTRTMVDAYQTNAGSAKKILYVLQCIEYEGPEPVHFHSECVRLHADTDYVAAVREDVIVFRRGKPLPSTITDAYFTIVSEREAAK